MKREIKFRAWRISSKEYVGFYSIGLYMFDNGEIYHGNLNVTKNYILEQFTGLTDKNNKEIYDGDIIRVCNNNNGYFEVIFLNQYVGGWNLKNPQHKDTISLGAIKQSEIEVIGNIHESPELLEI